MPAHTISTQALNLRHAAMAATGLPAASFSVRTERIRRRDHTTGVRFTEYGSATLSCRGNAAHQALLANRAALAAAHLTVHLVALPRGDWYAFATSDWNPNGTVVVHPTDGYPYRLAATEPLPTLVVAP